jgi:hypothetical protein
VDPAILASEPAEIGNIDQRKQQAGDPEDVHVGEEGD